MNEPLAGILAKLQRGDHHLERLELEVAAFLYSKPWHVAFERQPQRGPRWWLATFMIERYPPSEWSIRLGEAVHQYRSSLDHLMTDLARLRHKGYVARPDRTPNFPIHPTPGSFWLPNEAGRVPAGSIRKEVRAKHFTELERLQPKKPEDLRGSGEMVAPLALAVLRWMDDLDKHATLRPGFIGPKSVHYSALWNHGNTDDIDPEIDHLDFEEIYRPLDPLYHGAKLYMARFRYNPGMDVPMAIEPGVSFGMLPYDWVTLESIRACFVWVRRIVARFREITPEFRA